jgi:hypothetical protein
MTTVRALLFGDDSPKKLEQAGERLARVDAVPPHPEATAEMICQAVLTKVSELLNIEIADVLVQAWKTRSALLKAAQETHAQPGTTKQVTIRTYAVPWDHEMDVDVALNGVQLVSLTFVLSLQLEITALAAVVQGGRLTAVTAGDGNANATLRVQDQSPLHQDAIVAQGERPIDLRYEVRVGDGIALIEAARPLPA